MLKAWSNVSLKQAFNGWVAFVDIQQEKHDKRQRAVLFWSDRELAQVTFAPIPFLQVTLLCC